MLLKPLILPPLPDLLQEHSSPPLFERILTDDRRPLDRALRVRHRRRVLRLAQIVAHEDRACAAIAVDVGAAGRKWRRNLGQEFALVVGLWWLLLRVVEGRGEHCSFLQNESLGLALEGGEFRMRKWCDFDGGFGKRVFWATSRGRREAGAFRDERMAGVV